MRDTNNVLRLRLVIRRHTLPEVRLVFAVQLDTDPTIANLLEQVNEIVPLESNDWGLEDYAVELRDPSGHGFDCLHFQSVASVLKHDEQIFIRPLDTGDRRKRRLSGRDQISADGRHLIDGVPFGRPRLKTPRDRPPVDIPPLKRRKITYEAEEGEQEEPRLLLTEHGKDDSSRRRVRIRATFGNAEGEGSGGDEEDADGDFIDEDSDEDEADGAIDDIGESDLENELRELQEESQQMQGRGSNGPAVLRERAQFSAFASPTRLDLETLDKISALRAAFPTVQANVCERALAQQRGSTKLAYLRLRTHHQPAISLDAMLTHANSPAPKATATEDATDGDSEVESVASTVASMVKHYDQHGFPSGSILAGTAAAQMAEAMRKSGHPVKAPVHTKFDDDADQIPLPASSDKEDNASESQIDSDADDGSDDDIDSGPEVASSKIPQMSGGARISGGRSSSVSNDSEGKSEDESESDSSSDDDTSTSDSDDDGGESDDGSNRDSDDDSGFNDDSGHSKDSSNREAGGSDSSASSDEADSSSEDESAIRSNENASKARSAAGNAVATVQSSGSHDNLKVGQKPQSETIQQIKTDSVQTSRPVPPGQGKTSTQKRNARRRAAKQALKAAAEDDATTRATAPSPAAEPRNLAESVATKKAALLQRLGMMQELISQEAREVVINKNDRDSAPSEAHAVENSARKFGSGPLADHRQLDSANGHLVQVGTKATDQEDPEAWRNKITYRAVECCQEGIGLSEPPFPFVQRWDPQQQYFYRDRNNGGGRSKRKQRNREEFVEEGGRLSTKRRKYGDSRVYDGDAESYANDTTSYEEMTLNYDDEPVQVETRGPPEQAPGRNTHDEDDLPPLPADCSTLPTLGPGGAVAGMVLTWKQLLLSKATNWQPQVSALTGIVVDVLDEETLRVRLAKRDRTLDRNEKVYDDDGNRVYDNFEFPGMDDEDEEAAEQGYRTLDVADMIEPRVLRNAPGVVPDSSLPAEASVPHQKDASRDAIQDKEAATSTNRAHPDDAEVLKKEVNPGMDIDTRGGDRQSVISETRFPQEPVDTSISEDRRHEISQLIDDAGFRKDVDPSVSDLADNVALDLSSPSRQLEEMSHGTTMASPEGAQSQSHARPDLPSLTTSNNIDSQQILLDSSHDFSDDPHDGHDERRVVYPSLDVPPSGTGSLRSGRQVDPDFIIELDTRDASFHGIDDLAGMVRSTLGRHNDNGKDPSDSGSQSDSSASSFPSLSEIWPSASTNGSKKSPSKSATRAALKARKTDVAPDLHMKEPCVIFDNSGDVAGEDSTEHLSKVAQKLVDKPIEQPTPKKSSQDKGILELSTASYIKTEGAPPSPASAIRTTSSRTVRASGPPPAESKVVPLLTSNPEPELEEHYAEDSIDETCEEPGLPTGSGWVRKERTRRGVSMPASTVKQDAAPKSLASSQSGKQVRRRGQVRR